MASEPKGHLAEYRVEASLRDGTAVVIRAIRPQDSAALREGFLHLSTRTVYHRFLGIKRDLTDAELRYFTDLDFRDHIGLALELPRAAGPQLIAVGRAIRVGQVAPPGMMPPARPPRTRPVAQEQSAEVAFVVHDDFQGRGAGTLLLLHLAEIARGLGYKQFEAEVLPDNRQMLEVFANSGLIHRETLVEGLVHVEMDL